MSIPIEYSMQGGQMHASILLPNGQRLGTAVDMAPVVGAVCDQVGATDEERLGAYEIVGGDVDIIGALEGDEVGGRRKRRARRKARRKRIFGKIKKIAKPIVKVAKKIAKSKLVKGLAKVIKKIPVYGQLIDAAAKGVKGAVKAGRKIKRKLGKGRLRKKIKGGFKALAPAAKGRVLKRAAGALRLRGDGSTLPARSEQLRPRSGGPRAARRRRRSSAVSRPSSRAPSRRSSNGGRVFEMRLSTGRRARVELI